jgi:hypothetical protein
MAYTADQSHPRSVLRAGEENLREYLFNKHKHQLRIDCGVELAKLAMTPVDGRNW